MSQPQRLMSQLSCFKGNENGEARETRSSVSCWQETPHVLPSQTQMTKTSPLLGSSKHKPKDDPLPLSEESAASVFDVLQLKETCPHQQRLDVLLIYGQVTVVGKVDQSLKCTRKKGRKGRIS